MKRLEEPGHSGLDWLILIPTRFELELWRRYSTGFSETLNLKTELCGFGMAVSGIRTVSLIRELQPQRVMLCGIAGSYDHEFQIGQACTFDQVACEGLGVGRGSGFQSLGQLGWQQWEGDTHTTPITDCIRLNEIQGKQNWAGDLEAKKLLVTVAAASADPAHAADRRERYPLACAEDMEGFSVAAACQLSNTPLTIIRGVSNQAGDRQKAHWKVEEAMQSVTALAHKFLDSTGKNA